MSDARLRRQHAQKLGEEIGSTGTLADMDQGSAGLLLRELDQSDGERSEGLEKASSLGRRGSAAGSWHRELGAGLGGKRLSGREGPDASRPADTAHS
jgi:hypothetical protein